MVLGSPSACILVEPSGDVKVIATMERMFHPTYTIVGHVFPQVSVTHSALADAAAAIGETLASIGFIGALLSDASVLTLLFALLQGFSTSRDSLHWCFWLLSLASSSGEPTACLRCRACQDRLHSSSKQQCTTANVGHGSVGGTQPGAGIIPAVRLSISWRLCSSLRHLCSQQWQLYR